MTDRARAISAAVAPSLRGRSFYVEDDGERVLVGVRAPDAVRCFWSAPAEGEPHAETARKLKDAIDQRLPALAT
jgi:hypothetical protein